MTSSGGAPLCVGQFATEIYVLSVTTRLIDGPMLYHYLPEEHALEKLWPPQNRLISFRDGTGSAPISLLVTGLIPRACSRFGNRGLLAAAIEAGMVAQKVLEACHRCRIRAEVSRKPPFHHLGKSCDLPKTELPLIVVGLRGKSTKSDQHEAI